jgi:tetratricopeptide (TPR) repeat protein
MKKILLAAALLIIISTSHSQIKFENGSLADVMAKAKSENKVLMVDVLTDWCKWCIELDNKVYSNPKVAEFANTNQVNFKIDAEKGEGEDFAKKYKVNGYPTILFLDGNGIEIDRLIGYYPAKDFYEMMVDYNKGINTFKALKAALEKDPNDIRANLKLADKYMSIGELDSARTHLNKIAEIDPGNLSGKTDDAKYKLASLSGKDDIIRNLESFINDYPESDMLKDAYITLAESYYSVANDVPSAEKYFKDVISRFPDDEFVNISYGQYLNGRAYGLMNDTNSTDEDYKKGIILINEALSYTNGSVNEASSYYIQSRLFFNLKEFSKALESIDKALKIFDRTLYRDQKEAVEEQLNLQK